MDPDLFPPRTTEGDIPFYAAIGHLCHQWNHVEFFIYSLATDIMHLERKFHDLLFRHLGLKSVQQFIDDFASSNLDAASASQIAYANQFADRCRINRNYVVHGNFFPDDEGLPFLRIRADKNRKGDRTFHVSLADMHRVSLECELAGFLMVRAQILVAPKEQVAQLEAIGHWPEIEQSLFAKPPLPKLLSESLQTPPGRKSPPEPSV